jgi:TRAP-type C4-dicarboxylate transport system permease small subunit
MDIPMAWIYAIVPLALALLILVGIELIARLILHLAGGPSGIVMEGAMPAVVED